MAQSIFSNTVIATVGRAANLVLGVIATGILARLLGVSLYGVYGLLLAYGSLLQIAADFGLYLHLTRSLGQVPGEKNDQAYIVSQTAGLRLALLAASFGAGLLAASCLPSLRGALLPLGVVALGLSFQSISQLLMGIFQAQGVIWRATVGDTIGRLVQVVGLLLCASFFTDNFLLVATTLFLVSTSVTWSIHWYLRPRAFSLRPRFSKVLWKDILVQAWPLALLLFLNIIYFRIDMVILSLFRSAQEVGWYALAYRIIESGLFFPAMFGGLLLPRLTRLAGQDKAEAVQQLLQESLRFMLLVAGYVLVVGWQEARPILTIIAGQEFQPSVPLFQILLLAFICMLFGNIFGFSLVALRRQKVLVILYACLVAFNVLGNSATIPIWGAAAAAWMTVATELIASTVAGVALHRRYHFSVRWWYMLRVIGVTAATAAVWAAFPEQWPLVVRMVVGTGMYALCIWATALWRKGQFQALLLPTSSAYAKL